MMASLFKMNMGDSRELHPLLTYHAGIGMAREIQLRALQQGKLFRRKKLSDQRKGRLHRRNALLKIRGIPPRTNIEDSGYFRVDGTGELVALAGGERHWLAGIMRNADVAGRT